jgi:hypothetical protein
MRTVALVLLLALAVPSFAVVWSCSLWLFFFVPDALVSCFFSRPKKKTVPTLCCYDLTAFLTSVLVCSVCATALFDEQVEAALSSAQSEEESTYVLEMARQRLMERFASENEADSEVNSEPGSHGSGGGQYDENAAKQAALYSSAAYYKGSPNDALNYATKSQSFTDGERVTANYAGSELAAITAVNKEDKQSMWLPSPSFSVALCLCPHHITPHHIISFSCFSLSFSLSLSLSLSLLFCYSCGGLSRYNRWSQTACNSGYTLTSCESG